MAAVKFAKGTEEWQMFQDYWNLCQSVWDVEESDEYWQEVVERAEGFFQKYKTDFSKALSLALVNALERKSRARGKD